MADLIDRQAAIDALGEEPLVWHKNAEEVAERNQWRRDVAAIKALPPAQQWIPCEVRLPEKEGVYLLTTAGVKNEILDIGRYDPDYGWCKADRIIAWMPLPEPWKGET